MFLSFVKRLQQFFSVTWTITRSNKADVWTTQWQISTVSCPIVLVCERQCFELTNVERRSGAGESIPQHLIKRLTLRLEWLMRGLQTINSSDCLWVCMDILFMLGMRCFLLNSVQTLIFWSRFSLVWYLICVLKNNKRKIGKSLFQCTNMKRNLPVDL